MTSGPNPGPDITGELAGQEPTQHDPEVEPDGAEASANSPQGAETGNPEENGVPQPSQAQEGEDPDDDTQGHRYMSDENLKQAIEQVSGALAALREIGVMRRST